VEQSCRCVSDVDISAIYQRTHRLVHTKAYRVPHIRCDINTIRDGVAECISEIWGQCLLDPVAIEGQLWYRHLVALTFVVG
jgi:hypothetical protein